MIYKKLRFLEKKGAKFLFNVYLPKENGETTECDVVLIAPKGIVVFESKNYSGWIFGDEKYKTWTQTLPQGKGKKALKEKFFNPIMQNKLHVEYLARATGGRYPIYSIVAFSERCEFKKMIVNNPNVQVVKRNQVYDAIAMIFNSIPEAVISDAEIIQIYDRLYPFTQVSEAVKLQHIENIKVNQ